MSLKKDFNHIKVIAFWISLFHSAPWNYDNQLFKNIFNLWYIPSVHPSSLHAEGAFCNNMPTG